MFVSGSQVRPDNRGMEWAIVSTIREGEMETWSGESSVIKLIIPPVHDTVLRHGARAASHWSV